MNTIEQGAAHGRRYRWVIVGLLLAATIINYVDRQMIGLLKPTLQEEFGWSEGDYANIVLWFQAAYAIGYLGFGATIDRIGAKAGYAFAFVIWTAAHIAHGLVSTVAGFSAVRFALGIGESGNFPAGLKAVAQWFPPKERAFATGIFNAGSNVGAIITPLLVPILTIAYGWQWTFIITGAVSLVWLVAWLVLYRNPPVDQSAYVAPPAPADNAIEAPAIAAAAATTPVGAPPKIGWLAVLRMRETWAFASAKFLTDPIWWLFLFWLPDFFNRRHGLELAQFGPPLVAIYLVADIGSVAGGWSSMRMMRGGMSQNKARKLTMLLCGLFVVPIIFAQYVDSLWGAVALIALAAAGHQAWSANLLTLPSDTIPQNGIGSAIGIGGAAGAIGGMFMAQFTGWVLDTTGSYWPVFLVAGTVYLLALGVIQLLVPRIPDRSAA
ncbi:MFS transporter [Croceibacterium mercuriale]|uniref:MFS transporter n=1 Tax=Croceibacterium mercuriale TaxID=1572751 RepID=UPI00069104EE|nr:MFS transporter [Croceibacterium mercuriale]